MIFESASKLHSYLPCLGACLAYCLKCESTSRHFQPGEGSCGAFSVIGKTSPMVRLQLSYGDWLGAAGADLGLLVVPQQDVDVALLRLHDGDGGHLQTHAVRLPVNVEILMKIYSLTFW